RCDTVLRNSKQRSALCQPCRVVGSGGPLPLCACGSKTDRSSDVDAARPTSLPLDAHGSSDRLRISYNPSTTLRSAKGTLPSPAGNTGCAASPAAEDDPSRATLQSHWIDAVVQKLRQLHSSIY